MSMKLIMRSRTKSGKVSREQNFFEVSREDSTGTGGGESIWHFLIVFFTFFDLLQDCDTLRDDFGLEFLLTAPFLVLLLICEIHERCD